MCEGRGLVSPEEGQQGWDSALAGTGKDKNEKQTEMENNCVYGTNENFQHMTASAKVNRHSMH